MDSKSMHESKFNITKKQAQLILDLKKDELKKMRFLAMLDIDKNELKQLAKKDPTIVKAIGINDPYWKFNRNHGFLLKINRDHSFLLENQ